MVPTLLAAMLFLLGCKAGLGRQDVAASGRSNAAQPTVESTPAGTETASEAANEPLVVCFGDSITAGYGIEPEGSYPADMQRDLHAAGYRYRVQNMGVSGETTKDALLRVPHVLARKPEVVVVEFGGNDGLRGLPIAEATQNLAAIVTALRQGGTRVLLVGITLPPQYGTDYVAHFNAMYPAVARQTHVPLLPFIYKDVYNVPGYIQEDGVHPTLAGAKQVALNVEGMLKPMLRK